MSAIFPEHAGGRELLAKGRIPEENHVHVKPLRKKVRGKGIAARADRPGWIPKEIRHNWDTCPYAYQTEEELMPAGGLHGELLTYLAEILRDFLERKGLRFLADTFMLYRDAKGVKQRIAPDLLIMPFRSRPPSAYDLDKEPPPLAVAEITSPKSRSSDMEKKVTFYGSLGIPAYLAVDQVTDRGDLREETGLHLWRKIGDQMCKMSADGQGWLTVPEMKIKIKAQGKNLLLADMETGEELCDSSTLRQTAEMERQRADQEKQTAEMERQRAELEKQTAEMERQRAEQEKQTAEMERQRAEQEKQTAEMERQRAEQEKRTAEMERQRAELEKQTAEMERQRAELERQRAERLAEKLRSLGISPD